MRRELGDAAVVGPEHAGRRITAQQIRGLGEKARGRHDDGHARRNGLAVENT